MKIFNLFLGLLFITLATTCDKKTKSSENNKSEIEVDTTVNNFDITENSINNELDEKLLSIGECINNSYKAILKERINADSNAFVLIIKFKNEYIRVDTLDLRPSLTSIKNCANNYVLLESACGGPCYCGTFVFINSTRPAENYMYFHVSSSNEHIITHIENEEFENLKVHNLENGKEMSVNLGDCVDLNNYPCEIFDIQVKNNTLILTYDSSSENPKKKLVNISTILK